MNTHRTTTALTALLGLAAALEGVLLLGWIAAPEATWWQQGLYPRVELLATQRDQWAAIAYSTFHDLSHTHFGYSTVVPVAALLLCGARAITLALVAGSARPRPKAAGTAIVLLVIAGVAALTGALTQGLAQPTPANAAWGVVELAGAGLIWRARQRG